MMLSRLSVLRSSGRSAVQAVPQPPAVPRRPRNRRLAAHAIATPLAPPGTVRSPSPAPRSPPPAPVINDPPSKAAPAAPTAPASPILRVWSAYLQTLQRRPLATKAATSFCCTLLGDSIAQIVGGAPYSAARVLKLSAYSAVVGSSSGHTWHRWLDATVMPHAPASGRAVGMKVVLDQLLYTPVMTCAFLIFLKAVVDSNPAAIVPFIQMKLVSTLLSGYMLWPAVNVIMFRFVPQNLRILVGNIIGLGWGVFLSLTCVNGAAGSASGASAASPACLPDAPAAFSMAVETAPPLLNPAVPMLAQS